MIRVDQPTLLVFRGCSSGGCAAGGRGRCDRPSRVDGIPSCGYRTQLEDSDVSTGVVIGEQRSEGACAFCGCDHIPGLEHKARAGLHRRRWPSALGHIPPSFAGASCAAAGTSRPNSMPVISLRSGLPCSVVGIRSLRVMTSGTRCGP
jgi:hypothetical protein